MAKRTPFVDKSVTKPIKPQPQKPIPSNAVNVVAKIIANGGKMPKGKC
jgi:hypothetical protein